MLARALAALIALSAVALDRTPQSALSRENARATEFARMIASERAFAAATREIGVRDGFLTFFADDAIDVAPVPGKLDVVRVGERLRAQPPAAVPPAVLLTWSPRWGAISAAGDLGWLTGPFERSGGGQPVGHGAYFSVWKRQPDRTFKVWLDQGITTSAPVVFPEGFTPATPSVEVPPETSASATEGLVRMAEARFAEAASRDLAQAYRDSAMPDVRIHRNERGPVAGRMEAAGFMGGTFARITWAVLRVETAESDDLAVTVGSYDAVAQASEGRPGTPERGFWTRVWHRRPGGAWMIAFETNGIR